ncbi:ABC transporter ATP-binding protein [Rhodalgimonas zhirmunskyi]|uniref:ABC transporter ATP-binding protein/permease n=1 Tax=Rhodalgimonas zhirmunskyi TaxID=2964767 RepID=A0AAJ1UEE9_9RHOB|nr:ABC transporter ATP-binding protein [Rhodoalgimonas zhirmunskyi]MDQ2094781.1 ABC transporter ATP-binding protein/permease [Rhodoalgimonas zhirmunskyi]
MTLGRVTRWFLGLIDYRRRADGPPPQTLARFFLWALRGAWPPIIVATALFALGGALEAVTMWLLGRVIDATTAGPGAGFWAENWGLAAGSVLVLVGLRPLAFGLAGGFQSIAVMPNLFGQVMSRLNRHTLGQSVSFFDDDFAGRIAQKQMQAANGIVSVVQETVNAISFAGAAALGMLVLSGFVDPGMAVILALWIAAYVLLLRHYLPRIRLRSAARAGARAQVTGQIVDTVTNIKTVKLFAHDAQEDRAALESISEYRTAAAHWAAMAVWFRYLLFTLGGALPVVMVGYGLIRWEAGAVTSGELTAVGGMAIRLAQMTGWVSWTLMTIYADLGEVEDGMRTLSPDHGLVDAPGATELQVRAGEIAFRDVGFAYGREAGGVQGLDLTIKPGEKIGIVGASGAGKSTMVALLMRLYDPERGRIEIDGQDIAHVTQASLRAQVGMVTQDTAMFNRTARDNILYGRPDASEAEVLAAAEKAEAHEFIPQLEDGAGRRGYDAYLGERGVKLSGGQRQRIALARAILKDAPILVLDEATSALDSEVEAAIQTALGRVMEGKTVLAIAHRLSTIAQMDRIVVMEAGRIAEAGTHDDLLARGGIYAGLWAHQSGGFIGGEGAGAEDAAE